MSECGTLQASVWCPKTRLTNCTTTTAYIYHVTGGRERPSRMRELMRQVFDNETDAEQWVQEKLKDVAWTLLQS